MALLFREKMKSKKFTVTLSRAHKIVDRLKEKRNEVRKETEGLLAPKVVTLATGMKQDAVKDLTADAKIISNLDLMHQLSDNIGSIKSVIATANTKLGISTLLAANEGYTYLTAFLQPMVANLQGTSEAKKDIYARYSKDDSGTAIPVTELMGIVESLNKDPESKKIDVKVSRVTPSFAEKLQQIQEEYKNHSFGAMDTVNDKNKEKVEITLPVELVSFTGLK
jgi:beta-galactosidase GanA